jgi:hypothetical protein
VPLVVRGYSELLRADARASKDTKLGVRKALRVVAEPVRRDAEGLAVETIRNMGLSPQWARMRVGITTRVTYVAPRQRGARKNPYAQRPNLANLLAERSMEPALAQNVGNVERGFERMLDEIEADWAR